MYKFVKRFSFFVVLVNYTYFLNASHLSESENLTSLSQKIEIVYQSINDNWRYPSLQTDDIETVPSWPKEDVQTNFGRTLALVWDFENFPSFSDALNEIIHSKIQVECSNAARIVRLALINHVIGDQAMLKLARDLQKNRSRFECIHLLSWKFFKQKLDDKSPGIYAYGLVNIPEYTDFKNGYDHNHNVIKLSDNRYVGFDPSFFKTSQTYDAFSKYMFEKMTNDDYVINGREQAHIEFCQTLTYKGFEQKRISYQVQQYYATFDLQQAQSYMLNL